MISNLENTIKEAMMKSAYDGKLEGKLEVARRMLQQGLGIEDVMKFTGLEMTDMQKIVMN